MKRLCKHTGYFVQYYWKQLAVFLMITVVAISTLFIGQAHAWGHIAEGEERYKDAKLLSIVYGMIDDICGTEEMAEMTSKVKVEIGDGITVNNFTVPVAGTVIRTVNEALQTTGVTLTILFFCIGILNAFAHQQAYGEILLKRTLVLIITLLIIQKSFDLVVGISNVGNQIMDVVANTASSIGTGAGDLNINDIKNAMYDEYAFETDSILEWFGKTMEGIGLMLGWFVRLMIPWAAVNVTKVIIMFTNWSRAITIAVMAFLAPLAFADLTNGNGGGNANTMRFIKNVAAIALQGAVIVFAMYFAGYAQLGMLANSDLDTFFSSTFNMAALALAEAGICLKSQSIAKEIFGTS